MGHYRSEMGYEEKDRSEAERKAQRIEKMASSIEAAISVKGIARVLAEMANDPLGFKLDHS